MSGVLQAFRDRLTVLDARFKAGARPSFLRITKSRRSPRLAAKSAWDRPLSTSNLSLESSVLCRGFSCSPSEDGARHQTAAAGVVVVEKPADQLSGGVQSGNGVIFRIEHAPVLVYVQSTEGEGYTAGDGECEVGRGVQRESPVGLGRLDALSVFAVLYSRVEFAGTNGGIVLLDRPLQCLCVDASLVSKLGHSVGFVARHSGSGVLVLAEQRAGLIVEELVGKGAGLTQDLGFVPGVGVIAVVLSF